MKASTGRRAWKYNEWRREIAYQVDSRHSRVKWIGPYEGGSRVAGRGGRAERSKRRLSRWLFNYDNLLEGRKRGEEEEEIGTRSMHRLAL